MRREGAEFKLACLCTACGFGLDDNRDEGGDEVAGADCPELDCRMYGICCAAPAGIICPPPVAIKEGDLESGRGEYAEFRLDELIVALA